METFWRRQALKPCWIAQCNSSRIFWFVHACMHRSWTGACHSKGRLSQSHTECLEAAGGGPAHSRAPVCEFYLYQSGYFKEIASTPIWMLLVALCGCSQPDPCFQITGRTIVDCLKFTAWSFFENCIAIGEYSHESSPDASLRITARLMLLVILAFVRCAFTLIEQPSNTMMGHFPYLVWAAKTISLWWPWLEVRLSGTKYFAHRTILIWHGNFRMNKTCKSAVGCLRNSEFATVLSPMGAYGHANRKPTVVYGSAPDTHNVTEFFACALKRYDTMMPAGACVHDAHV